MTTPKPLQVACPNCGRKIDWTTDNHWRPFCSERCKLVDLGEWFSDNRSIPGEDAPVEDDENQQ